MIGFGPASEPASAAGLAGRGGHDAAPSTRIQRATSASPGWSIGSSGLFAGGGEILR